MIRTAYPFLWTILGSATCLALGCGGANDPGEGSETNEGAFVPGTAYTLVHKGSGKCVEAGGPGADAGAQVQLAACDGSAAQSFRPDRASDGTFHFVNPSSSKCLALDGGSVDCNGTSTGDGTAIALLSCDGTGAQSFRIRDLGGDDRSLVEANGGKCVTVANGTQVQISSCDGSDKQRFQLVPVSSNPGSGSGGGGGVGGGVGGGDGTLDVPPPAARGASLPYWEYEAEDSNAATTTGTILPVSTTEGELASEASGRSAVKLQGTGQNVSFTLAHRANSIVVRYSIPDSPDGGGRTATLGLYVNGVRQDLKLTSRYSWTYGNMGQLDSPSFNNERPSNGLPHHFYDEARAMFPQEMPAGTVIKLQKDSQDSADWYAIDLADFEDVAPPVNQPDGSLSIADYGATPDDGTDDSAAVIRAIADATSQKKVLWIPKGNFTMAPAPADQVGVPYNQVPKLILSGSITIRGAGMWYSTLEGFGAMFQLMGKPTSADGPLTSTYDFRDFSLFGDVTWRKDANGGWQGFDGPWGLNSKIENVWLEHHNVGIWLGMGWQFSGPLTSPLTKGLHVKGIRIRDMYADGINMANGTTDTVIEQSHLRNVGDDGLVTWSYASDGSYPCTNNMVQFNTVQAVWKANCFALYGGKDNHFENNTCADTANMAGMFVATVGGFNVIPFSGNNVIAHNTLTRAGGWHGPNYDYAGEGALLFFADSKPITNIVVDDMLIDRPILAGIQFSGGQNVSNVKLNNITVKDYGAEGIQIEGGVNGSAEFNNVAISGAVGVPIKNDNGGAFTIVKGNGNTGW